MLSRARLRTRREWSALYTRVRLDCISVFVCEWLCCGDMVAAAEWHCYIDCICFISRWVSVCGFAIFSTPCQQKLWLMTLQTAFSGKSCWHSMTHHTSWICCVSKLLCSAEKITDIGNMSQCLWLCADKGMTHHKSCCMIAGAQVCCGCCTMTQSTCLDCCLIDWWHTLMITAVVIVWA